MRWQGGSSAVALGGGIEMILLKESDLLLGCIFALLSFSLKKLAGMLCCMIAKCLFFISAAIKNKKQNNKKVFFSTCTQRNQNLS